MVSFVHSVIGASHIKNGMPCQDSSLCINNDDYTFIAVSDGHGSKQYFRSDVGSRFAVKAAYECMTAGSVNTALNNSVAEKERERIISRIKKGVISKWNALVTEHLIETPFTDDEILLLPERYDDFDYSRKENYIATVYGATVIASLLTDTFFLSLQIGDGSCVTLSESGEFNLPVPACDRCFLNETASLCEKNAIESFRHYYSASLPIAVLIATDGIDDCFARVRRQYDFYKVILTSLIEKDEEHAKSELFDYFPQMSEEGSGDDISIGVIVNIKKK
jgi:serine/threonine protein phosphatase PrpC